MGVQSDGQQGVIVHWLDNRDGDTTFFVGRIGPDGQASAGWLAGGNRIGRLRGRLLGFDCSVDGSGGCYLGWLESDGGSVTLRVHHVASDGAEPAPWPVKFVFPVAGFGDGLTLVRDRPEGLLLMWTHAAATGIPVWYGIRLAADGSFSHGWDLPALQLSSAISTPDESFGLAGVVVTASSRVHLFANLGSYCGCEPLPEIHSIDDYVFGERTDPMYIAYTANEWNTFWGYITPTGDGGAFVTHNAYTGTLCRLNGNDHYDWCVSTFGTPYPDGRDGVIEASNNESPFYLRRLGPDGRFVSGWNPLTFNVVPASTSGPSSLVADGRGGAILVWYSGSNYTPLSLNLEAADIPEAGDAETPNPLVGIDLAAGPGTLSLSTLVPSVAGSAIAVWLDYDASPPQLFGQRVTVDAPVPVLAHLVSQRFVGSGLELRWFVSGHRGGQVRLERREGDRLWQLVGEDTVDGTDMLVITDQSTQAGAVYEYRLVYDGAELATSGPIRIGAPIRAARLLVLGSGMSGSLRVRATNPDAAPGRLEAFDVSGRQVASAAVEPLSETEIELPLSTHHSGVGFVRLRCGMATVDKKVPLLH